MRCPRCGEELELIGRTCQACGVDLSDGDSTGDRGGEERAPPGTRLMARWTDDFWYNAEVDAVRDRLRHVRYFDGLEMWVEPSEYTCVDDAPVERDREGGELRVGQMVKMLCPDQRWRPGLIDGVYGRIWHVTLHDFGQAWISADMLLAEEEVSVVDLTDGSSVVVGAPGRGARVLAKYPNGLWFPAMIDDEEDELRRVLFFMGKEMWLEPHQISSPSDPATLHDGEGHRLAVGARVLGQWSDERWYPGVADARFGKLWHVSFDDYDQGWLEGSKLIRGQAEPRPVEAEELLEGLMDPIEALERLAAAQRSARQWRLAALGALLVALLLSVAQVLDCAG